MALRKQPWQSARPPFARHAGARGQGQERTRATCAATSAHRSPVSSEFRTNSSCEMKICLV